MNVEEKLRSLGWRVSPEWLNEYLENNEKNVEKIIKAALDEDIRKFGLSFISDEITRGKTEWVLKSNCVLQIQKISNVSAPKANEESNTAPRLLLIQLTDGSQTLFAIDLHQLPSLSLNTPPGTKIRIKCGRLYCLGAFAILDKSSIELLGGNVAPLVEKWQISRSLAKYNRSNWASTGPGGPPPWVPFGQKVVSTELHDGKFKSFGGQVKEKENDDFEQQLKATIAEVNKAKLGGRKQFGGGKAVVSDGDVGVENSYVRPMTREPRGDGRGGEGFGRGGEGFGRGGEGFGRGGEGGGRGRGRGGRRERRGRGGGYGSNDASEDIAVNFPSKPQTLFDFLETKISDMKLKSVKSEQPVEQTQSNRPQVRTSQNLYQVPKSIEREAGSSAEATQRRQDYTQRPSRSNVPEQQPQEQRPRNGVNWRPGDRCLAQYWEDNKYYPASIHAVAASGATCVVLFLQFGNYEEVLLEHVKPQPQPNRGRGGNGSARPSRGRYFTPSNRSRATS